VYRNVAIPALLIVVAASACSGGGSTLTPSAQPPLEQSQTSERAPASYGGIPDIVRLPETPWTPCASPTASPAPSATADTESRHTKSYGGIPDIVSGVVADATDGCSP